MTTAASNLHLHIYYWIIVSYFKEISKFGNGCYSNIIALLIVIQTNYK
jgi:hypothetical protein